MIYELVLRSFDYSLEFVFFSAVTSAFQLFTCKLCLQFSGLRMPNFTWNRFPIKNLLIDSLLTPIVESTYLNISNALWLWSDGLPDSLFKSRSAPLYMSSAPIIPTLFESWARYKLDKIDELSVLLKSLTSALVKLRTSFFISSFFLIRISFSSSSLQHIFHISLLHST